MKKRFLVLSLAVFCIAALPLLAAAEKTGICGDNLTWKLSDTGVLTVSGTGAWSENLGANPEWSSTVKQAKIQSGVTSIGYQAFYNCLELTSVSFPSTVKRIGDSAFLWCGKLTGISIPSGVTYIGESAFTYSGLKNVTIPANVNTIGRWAFSNCTSLKSVTILSSSVSILDGVFDGCPSDMVIYCFKGSTAQAYANDHGITVSLLKPVITSQPSSITVNEGSVATFKLTAKYASSYQWYYRNTATGTWTAVSNGGTSASYSLTAQARHNGYQYRCKVTNSFGTAYSNIVTLTVISTYKPTITTQPTNQKVNEGSKATFKVVATGADDYQWFYRKTSTSAWTAVSNNGTSATYTLTTEARHNGYQYRCLVKNSAGGVYSKIVTLTVVSKPVITKQPSNVTVNVGENAVFKVTASGAEKYQWYYKKPSGSWTAVSNNGTSATYTLTAEARHNGYKYYCKVSNSAGSVLSNTVTLTVQTVTAPVISSQPSSVTVNEGEKATFKVSSSNADSYRWYYRAPSGDWTPVSNNGASAVYTLTTAARHNGYKYRCKISNIAGCVWSNTVTLTVITKPVIIGQPGNVKVSAGMTAAFNVTAENATAYQWYYRTSSTGQWIAVKNNGTSATYRLTTAARHNGYQYYCRVSNSAGYVNSNVATLTVK